MIVEFFISQELPTRIEMESCVQQWVQQLNPLLEAEEQSKLKTKSLNDEIIYWQNRSQNLENVFEQLKEGVVRQMAATLEEIGSAQSATFKTLLRRVIVSLAEAQEIALHMKPLIQPLSVMDNCDVTDMIQQMKIILHIASLLWCTCAHFRQPIHLAHLLRQVGDVVIERCRSFLDARSIFTWDTDEAMEKITAAQDVITSFRHFYTDEKENMAVLIERLRDRGQSRITVARQETRCLWNPSEEIIFEQMKKFEKRLACIIKIFLLIQEFARLKRLEFSPMGGRSLTIQVQNICQQFIDLKSPIITGTHGDCMDPDNDLFARQSKIFLQDVSLLEEKLACVIGYALSDVSSPLNAWRIIQLLGSFRERPCMHTKISQGYPRIVALAWKDAVYCSDYLKGLAVTECSIVDTVQQILQLERRTRIHVETCRSMGLGSSDVSALRTLEEIYQQIDISVQSKIELLIERWTLRMQNVSIRRPLFAIDSNGMIASGADDSMARMICEYRQLDHLLTEKQIPGVWQEWGELYRSLRSKMKSVDVIVSCYSNTQFSLTQPLRALFYPKLNKIKEEIVCKSQSGNWTWDSLDPQLGDDLELISETSLHIYQSMKKIQLSSESILNVTSSWSKGSLIELQDNLLPMDEQLCDVLNRKYQEYSAASKKITAIVFETQQLMSQVEPQDWNNYYQSIDSIILEGIISSILSAYGYLIEHGSRNALYNIQLTVSESGVQFIPSLENNSAGLVQQFDNLLKCLTKISSLITSFVGPCNFTDRVECNSMVLTAQQKLYSSMATAVHNVQRAVDFLQKFSFLWQTDKATFLKTFLESGCVLGSDLNESLPENPATFTDFREQIEQLERWKSLICDKLDKLHCCKKVCWVKLDTEPAVEVLLFDLLIIVVLSYSIDLFFSRRG